MAPDTVGAEIVTPVTAQPEPVAEKKDEPKKNDDESVEFFKSKAKAMEKEAAAAAKKLAAYEKAEEERKQAEMSELEKANARAAKAEADLKAKDIAILRRDVADKVGLPAVLADRLKGETPEEIEADANALLETLPKQEAKKPNISPTNPVGGSLGETVAQKKERLGMVQSRDVFSEQFNIGKDGGPVYFQQE